MRIFQLLSATMRGFSWELFQSMFNVITGTTTVHVKLPKDFVQTVGSQLVEEHGGEARFNPIPFWEGWILPPKDLPAKLKQLKLVNIILMDMQSFRKKSEANSSPFFFNFGLSGN